MNPLKQSVCLLALLLLSACAPTAVPTPQIKTVTINVKEFAYAPAQINAKVGEAIQINFVNAGSVLHDFSIQKIALKGKAVAVGDSHDMSGMSGMAKEDPAVHVAANAGKTGTVTFTPTEAGEYEFNCTVAGHKAAGLVGKLIVVAP